MEEVHVATREKELNDIVAVLKEAVQMDGGDIALQSADLTTGSVFLQLSGACGSCSVAGSTIEDGVKRVMRQRLDWVTDIECSVLESTERGSGGWRG
jgi:Fe-S cluster biogenesis protein NfuA